MAIQHAAWVPEDAEQDFDDAAALAVRWVRQRCAEEQAKAVLVLNALGAADGISALRGLEATSPQARTRPASGRPVLAYVPSPESLAYAEELARNSSLVVVEGFSFAVAGWAREHGAVNLLRPEEPTEVPDERWVKALDRLEFHKNNGFGDMLGKKAARDVVAHLRTADLLDCDGLVSAMAARGATARALKALGQIIDRA
jgi:hypothetical protein